MDGARFLTGPKPINDLLGWFVHRLTANYWSLALCAVLAAPLVFAASLHADRNGLTAWILEHDLAPVATAETARDAAALIAGIDAAFLTLYFSISLIVLTIAAGNLGVRLIDRWLAKRLVRISIAGLCFTLIHATLTMNAMDADAGLIDTPLATFASTVLLLMINTVMLAVATHDLGRTMFIDRAIDAVASDGRKSVVLLQQVPQTQTDWADTVKAPRNGYIEGVELKRLSKALASGSESRLEVAPGQHVLKGQTLLSCQSQCENPKAVLRAIPIGKFRSNTQGAVFQIRLLVEIAARALSPAVNDFYTALAAVDALTEVASGHCRNWVDEGNVPVSLDYPSIALPGQDFRGLFEDPLAALRQAAADYPSVSIRIIGNVQRLVRLHCSHAPGLVVFLVEYASELHQQARARCEIDMDRDTLDRRLAELKKEAGTG
ncbi:DUF2254 family protein [Qipengyuania sp. 483]